MQKAKILEQGSALISALFIMTLVAIAATAMSTRLQLDIYRTRLAIASDKLYLASQAISFWAMGELASKENQFAISDKQGKVLEFPSKLQTIYPDAKIKGSLYDLQARFNLNNLSDKKHQIFFLKLLENIAKQLSPAQARELTIALQSWFTTYQPGHEASALFKYYLEQKPPYFPAQMPMKSLSEFRLVKDVDAKLFRSLQNYLTVLPETTAINLNTASIPILMSLGNGLTEGQASELIAARGEKGIFDLKEVGVLLQKLNIRSEQLTLTSEYFMSVATVTMEDLNLINYSIFKRGKDRYGKFKVSLIAESLNSYG